MRVVYRVLPDPSPEYPVSQYRCSRVGYTLEARAQGTRTSPGCIERGSAMRPGLATGSPETIDHVINDELYSVDEIPPDNEG